MLKNDSRITPAFILVHIRCLKPGKAPGSDGLQPENLMYGTVKLFEHLAILFQASITQQQVPDTVCEDLVMCIFKRNKDPKSCDAFRPITVSSTIGKLLDELIYNEMSTKCDQGDNHFGFHVGLGVQNYHATSR